MADRVWNRLTSCMPLYCSFDMQGAFIPDLHSSIWRPDIYIWRLFFLPIIIYWPLSLKNWPLKQVLRGHFGPHVKFSGWNNVITDWIGLHSHWFHFIFSISWYACSTLVEFFLMLCSKFCKILCTLHICFSEQSQVTGISQAAFESTEAVVQPGKRHVQWQHHRGWWRRLRWHGSLHLEVKPECHWMVSSIHNLGILQRMSLIILWTVY